MSEVAAGAIPKARNNKGWIWIAGVVGAVLLSVVVFNLTVWLPVSSKLGEDSRNDQIGLRAYRTALVHPNNITLDLAEAGAVAPIDLFRVLFQSAEALQDRSFNKVTLARNGKAVFVMEGSYFQRIGEEYGAGQNPLYLMRTLPENLYRPDGTEAYGSWSGGWLGVMSGQFEDANDFASDWVTGR